MSQAEFEQRYATNSDMTLEQYHACSDTLPCDCGEEGCSGWQSVSKDQRPASVAPSATSSGDHHLCG